MLPVIVMGRKIFAPVEFTSLDNSRFAGIAITIKKTARSVACIGASGFCALKLPSSRASNNTNAIKAIVIKVPKISLYRSIK